jgi:hypothetical protein
MKKSRQREEYLPERYSEELSSLQAPLQYVEFPPQGIPIRQIIKEQMGSMASAQFGFQKFANREAKSVQKKSRTLDEFDSFLKLNALRTIGKDIMFRTAFQALIGAASEAVVEEDTEASNEARSIAETIINFRAAGTAYSVLDAHNLTYMEFKEDVDTVWNRAIATHQNHPKAKPPAHIGDKEGEEFWALIQRQQTASLNPTKLPIKPSRSKILTGIRLAKSMREMGPIALESDPIAMHIKSIGEVVTRILVAQPSFEITPTEIIRSMQTALKARRYMDSAAVLEPSVRNDPIYRYVSYLGRELGGYDSHSELAVFDRDVRRKARNNR